MFRALHHLLHAHDRGARNASLSALHPRWEERDREPGEVASLTNGSKIPPVEPIFELAR